MILKNDKCVIPEKYGSKKFIAIVQMKKNLMFPLKTNTCFISQCVVANPKKVCTTVQKKLSFKSMIEDPSKLWNLRYQNLGYVGLNFLSNKRILDGFPSVKEFSSKCEACILSKKHRLSFNFANSKRAREPLELVQIDLVCPMNVTSIGESTHLMTFIDDFGHRTWVYLLKNKSEFFHKFLQFKA